MSDKINQDYYQPSKYQVGEKFEACDSHGVIRRYIVTGLMPYGGYVYEPCKTYVRQGDDYFEMYHLIKQNNLWKR